MRLTGWLGSAEIARERNDQQYLYVNGRAVSDATVRHAVRLAYGASIGDAQHPCWLLYLELDPREVDVNVHPAKHEVRFREVRMVHDFVRAGVHDVLANCVSGPSRAVVHMREVSPSYARDHATPAPRAPAPESIKVLALLPDGLLVARRGDEFLLARCADLLRTLAQISLRDIAQGTVAPISRPLLLPERLPTAGSVLGDECTVQLLETFGFSLRNSAERSVLLLGVPECLSRVPAGRWRSVFANDGVARDDARHWARILSEVAAEQALHDADAAALVLAQLIHVDESAAPWVVLDARRAASLFAAMAGAR
jgi:DNA mismatch repair ATPase MutL